MGSCKSIYNQPKHTKKTNKSIMSVVVILGGTIKADKVAEFKAYCAEAIPKAKAQAGCEWVKVLVDTENPASVAIFQNWTDQAAQQAYADAAKAEGKLAAVVGSCLEAGSFKKRVFKPYSA